MLKFFVLEDDPNLLPLVRKLLETEFPGARVNTATTRNDALDLLSISLTENDLFDAAIIDCCVPVDSASAAEVEYTVGEAFRDSSPETGLIHFTAYVKERSQMPRELADLKLSRGNTRMFLLKQAGWPERLIHAVHRIVESPVERELENFDRGHSTGRLRAPTGHDRRLQSSDAVWTEAFASLCERVEKLWPGSTPEFRNKVREVLGAEEVNGQVHVGIAPDTTGAVDVSAELPPASDSRHDNRGA